MDYMCEPEPGAAPKPLWQRQIPEARTVDEVVWIVRDYLANLTPEDLAKLPVHCRPDRVKSEGDIQYWTMTLIELKCIENTSMNDLRLLHQVSTTFALASLRISDIYKALSEGNRDEA